MSRFTAQDLDDIRARNPLADIAGGYVKLRRAGARLVGPCPICGGRATSHRFEVLQNGEGWVCAVCPDGGDVIRLVEKAEGCDFLAAIERLGGLGATSSSSPATIDPAEATRLFEAREQKRLAQEKTAAGYREAERKRLWRTWQGAMAIRGTPAAIYLGGRELLLPDSCPGLRYQPSMPYWHGETLPDSRGKTSPRKIHVGPAMLAAFIRPDGKFGGLHITWLSADLVPVKAEIIDPDSGEVLNSKKMRGSKTGAFIWIAGPPARAGDEQGLAPVAMPTMRRLIVGEGIETVLAVYTAHVAASRVIDDMAFWAAGDLGNMAGRATETIRHPTLKRPNNHPMRVPGPVPDPDDAGLSIPDSVEELILLGDGDSEKVLTENAMTRAARRYARPGRTIRVAFAPAGQDFNDVLRAPAEVAA